jgi:hypothetical protein
MHGLEMLVALNRAACRTAKQIVEDQDRLLRSMAEVRCPSGCRHSSRVGGPCPICGEEIPLPE